MIITQSSKFKTQNFNSNLKTDVKSRAYSFAVNIINLIEKIPRSFSTDVVTKQLLRAATSIGANIIEAKSASSRRDFINFYNHALKSANEVKFWLNLLKDTEKAPNEKLLVYIQEVSEISNMLASSILTMKRGR